MMKEIKKFNEPGAMLNALMEPHLGGVAIFNCMMGEAVVLNLLISSGVITKEAAIDAFESAFLELEKFCKMKEKEATSNTEKAEYIALRGFLMPLCIWPAIIRTFPEPPPDGRLPDPIHLADVFTRIVELLKPWLGGAFREQAGELDTS